MFARRPSCFFLCVLFSAATAPESEKMCARVLVCVCARFAADNVVRMCANVCVRVFVCGNGRMYMCVCVFAHNLARARFDDGWLVGARTD